MGKKQLSKKRKAPSQDPSLDERELLGAAEETAAGSGEAEASVADEEEEVEEAVGPERDLVEEAREGKASSKRTPGVIYLSSVPEGMNVGDVRQLLGRYGELGRVYLKQREALGGRKARKGVWDEGWVEFASKKTAKRVAASLNREAVGGKRRRPFYEALWNMRYLKGFRWVHLGEQLRYEEAVRRQRTGQEVAAAKRTAAFFSQQLAKGAHLRKLQQRVLQKNGLWTAKTKTIPQTKSLDEQPAGTPDTDHLLHMVLGQ